MSFQAYIDNIKAKTGKSPDDFKKLAEEKGFLQNGQLSKTVKATEITNWLRACSGIHQRAASGKFYFILRWIFSP